MQPCPACGTPNVPGSVQCARCGAALSAAAQPGYGAQPQQGYSAQPHPGYPGQQPTPGGSLDISSVLSQSFDLWKKTLGTCIVLQAVGSAPAAIFGGIGGYMQMSATEALLQGRTADVSGAFVGPSITFFGAIISLFVVALTHGAIIQTGLSALVGRPVPSVGDAIGAAKTHYLSMLGATFLSMIAAIVGMILCFVPGIIAIVALCLATTVVIAESRGATDALQRSLQVTEGSRMEIFLIFLVVGLAAIAFFAPLMCVTTMVFSGPAPGVVSPIGLVIQQVFSYGFGVVFGSFGPMLVISIYQRRTGFGASTDGAAVANVFG